MKFVVGKVSYFNSIGFDTSEWRQSNDNKKTLCHLKFSEALIGDINEAVDKGHITIYDIDSKEFQELLDTEFTAPS